MSFSPLLFIDASCEHLVEVILEAEHRFQKETKEGKHLEDAEALARDIFNRYKDPLITLGCILFLQKFLAERIHASLKLEDKGIKDD